MYHHRRTTMANPARIDRDDEKRMLPCRYFLAGFCHKGPRCKFFHPNMHIREPFVQVPDLPSSFSMIPQHGRNRMSGGDSGVVPSLFDMTGPRPRSRAERGGLRTPTSGNSASASSLSPMSRIRTLEMAKNILSPSSHAYSEYQTYARRMNDYDEEEEEEDEDDDSDGNNSNSPDRKPIQNTVFNHIDWSEFLVPGIAPPLPTPVPDQGAALSPMRQVDIDMADNTTRYTRSTLRDTSIRRPLVKVTIDDMDMPPEGFGRSMLDNVGGGGGTDASGEKKLSPKEELQLKVKQIAQELADEPIQHVRSLDSFFRSFKFNGYNVTAGPSTSNSASSRLFGDESNKENTKQNLIVDSSDGEHDAIHPDEHEDGEINSN